jgi:ubiquinol-cytochrome c reductase iron-sulfur subunit
MSRVWRFLLGLVVLLGGLRRRRREEEAERERIVEPAPGAPGAELAVAILLILTAVSAVAFIVFLATDSLGGQTQLMGASLGACFLFLAAALIVAGKRVIATEEIEEDYPEPGSPQEQEEIGQIVRESGDGITRKGLLRTTGAVAIAAVGAALAAPLTGFGPFLKTRELQQAPWRRGRRLVDQHGKPYRADDISTETFYTAFPEGEVSKETIGGPIVLVRLDPAALKLPPERAGWAPGGIVGYSKICTHAGCAVALYRKPLFPPVEPRPALVCPCHYSTFDPAEGAKVIFGPAGRPLPQLPLTVDSRGYLRASGNLSGPPGPGWWGVRKGEARST